MDHSSADGLAEILMQKMEKSVVLKEDIAHLYRMDGGHKDKNSDFLIRSMENYMGRERYKTNRANDLHPVLTPNRDPIVGAPSVTGAPCGVDPSVARERKRKKQERKDRAAAKAAAAPVPTPAGKGKGKGKVKGEKQVCYYFNQPGGCPKTAEECWFKHKKLSAAEVAKMV